jgi:type 1 fimbriae regulatory protein FimB/type 1 fimbriae regulatory protein FimE
MLAKSHLARLAPNGEKRAVTTGRRPNADYRKREHLTETEIEKLIEAAKTNRHGHRDSTMILVAYRHGFRASELCELRWDDIDLRAAAMHVKRLKHGQATTHQVGGDELRALRKLQRDQEPKSAFVFVNERGTRSTATASIGWSSEPARRPVCPSGSMPT